MDSTEITTKLSNNRLGDFIKSVRCGMGLSLKNVEESTCGDVSKAYLSQLESGMALNPSRYDLYALSLALATPYEELMVRAGYHSPSDLHFTQTKHGNRTTYAIENLTANEEQELLKFLSFIRWQKQDATTS